MSLRTTFHSNIIFALLFLFLPPMEMISDLTSSVYSATVKGLIAVFKSTSLRGKYWMLIGSLIWRRTQHSKEKNINCEGDSLTRANS